MMARREEEILVEDPAVPNKLLNEIFTMRTVDSIKEQPRNQTYKDTVVKYSMRLASGPSSNSHSPPATPSIRGPFLNIDRPDTQRAHGPLYSRAMLDSSPSSEQLRDGLSTKLLQVLPRPQSRFWQKLLSSRRKWRRIEYAVAQRN